MNLLDEVEAAAHRHADRVDAIPTAIVAAGRRLKTTERALLPSVIASCTIPSVVAQMATTARAGMTPPEAAAWLLFLRNAVGAFTADTTHDRRVLAWRNLALYETHFTSK